ncbi:lariat debranching enzyme [Coprinopsis sp. MPI-PUGE-AT-0042]|nr:lariat debranching enzyme [Coprinopsis sp. MPI-PUGE-AT-0042]
MKIAIEGCCHGHLDAIYKQISILEQKNGYKVDVLLICGDFQAIRNSKDLQCMSVPEKYRALGDFHKYYTGESVAPILTLIIGGNHEASNYLWELFHGGWLAPNMYYLGNAGCVQVNGIRIAGVSGIFKGNEFRIGHHERVPYNGGAMRSVYHTREYAIRRLSLLSSPEVVLSHDWPQHIAHHGDLPGLLRRKRFFEADIQSGRLGSPPLMGLLQTIQPQWWFAAHLHVRFEASVQHTPQGALAPSPSAQVTNQAPPKVENPDEIAIDDIDEDEEGGPAPTATATAPITEEVASMAPPAVEPANPDEIMLDDEEDEVEAVRAPAVPPVIKETKFLALDKCLPNRQFLEVVDIESPSSSTSSSPPTLCFDPEWLAINRAFHPWFSTTHQQRQFPPEEEARAMIAKELEWVKTNLKKNDAGLLPVEDVQKFEITAPGPCPQTENPPGKFKQPQHYPNPQTRAFCKMLDVEDKVNGPAI